MSMILLLFFFKVVVKSYVSSDHDLISFPSLLPPPSGDSKVSVRDNSHTSGLLLRSWFIPGMELLGQHDRPAHSLRNSTHKRLSPRSLQGLPLPCLQYAQKSWSVHICTHQSDNVLLLKTCKTNSLVYPVPLRQV